MPRTRRTKKKVNKMSNKEQAPIPAEEIIESDSQDELPTPDAHQGSHVQEDAPEPYRFYFIAAVKVLWVREGKGKERTVNVMINLSVPYITQNTLNDINRAACGRVMSENKVPGEDVREAIVLGVSMLGQMTDTVFREEIIPNVQTDEFKPVG